MTSHSTWSNPGTSRGSSESTCGSDSSSFRQGIWMTSFIARDRRVCPEMTRVLRIVVLGTCVGAVSSPAGASGLGLGVSGNHLVDESGPAGQAAGRQPQRLRVRLRRGFRVLRRPDRHAQHPRDEEVGNQLRPPAAQPGLLARARRRQARARAATAYRAAIDGFVARLNQAGLYVVIDEHVAAPAGQRALGIIPMPDADSSPAFWSSVAAHFASNHVTRLRPLQRAARRSAGTAGSPAARSRPGAASPSATARTWPPGCSSWSTPFGRREPHSP